LQPRYPDHMMILTHLESSFMQRYSFLYLASRALIPSP
jgi:hypothetical protein